MSTREEEAALFRVAQPLVLFQPLPAARLLPLEPARALEWQKLFLRLRLLLFSPRPLGFYFS